MYRLVVALSSPCELLEDAGRDEPFEVGTEFVGRVNSSGLAVLEFDGEWVERCRVIGKVSAIFFVLHDCCGFQVEKFNDV